MHLASQSDAGNGGHVAWMTGGKLAHRQIGRLPPRLRILFRPPLMQTADGKRNGPAGDDAGVSIDKNSLYR